MTPHCKYVGFIALIVLFFHALPSVHFASDPSLYLTPEVHLKEVVDNVIEQETTRYGEHHNEDSSHDIRNDVISVATLSRVSSLLHLQLSAEHIAKEPVFAISFEEKQWLEDAARSCQRRPFWKAPKKEKTPSWDIESRLALPRHSKFATKSLLDCRPCDGWSRVPLPRRWVRAQLRRHRSCCWDLCPEGLFFSLHTFDVQLGLGCCVGVL
eukprot:PhM_4_TR18649/c2_g4_i3/m.23157